MKKFKFIWHFVFLFSLVGLLAGCNKADSEKKAGMAKKKLVMWHIQTQEDQKKTLDDAIARFMQDYPEYDVEVVSMQNDAYKTKLKISMGANEMPDIFIHWSGGPMISYIDAGQVADITEFMDKDGYKDRFMNAAIDQVTYKGRLWGVPVENTVAALFFYNKKIFTENNLVEPKTLKEFEAICETLKQRGITPLSLANKTKWTGSMYYMYLVDRFGGPAVFRNAANRMNDGTFEDPAFTYAGDKIQEWVRKGYFNAGFNGLDEDTGQSRALLYAGKAAMTLMGSWIVSTINGENPDFISNLGVFPFPAISEGKGDSSNIVGTAGDNFYSVAASCKYKDAAFTAITYLLDDMALKERLAEGKIPPLKEVTAENPIMQRVLSIIKNAKATQLWYDQYLPPGMSELHKDTVQELFGLTKTPEQVNKIMENEAEQLAGK